MKGKSKSSCYTNQEKEDMMIDKDMKANDKRAKQIKKEIKSQPKKKKMMTAKKRGY